MSFYPIIRIFRRISCSCVLGSIVYYAEWLLWFLKCFEKALDSTRDTLAAVLEKAKFWEYFRDIEFNVRQRKLINMLFDGFLGKLTSGKWAKIAKCSSDTALNDINDLVQAVKYVEKHSKYYSCNIYNYYKDNLTAEIMAQNYMTLYS